MSTQVTHPAYPYPLVLASRSAARARLLSALGYAFSALDPAVDEGEVKRSLRASGASPAQIAESLAELKALKISALAPGQLVIAGDQVLECGGIVYDKPTSLADAHDQLSALAGRSHRLETSVCLVLDGQRLWHHRDHATITLNKLSNAQIDAYLERFGQDVMASVGCYRVEAEGALVIAALNGDPYTIQGLPMLALVSQLYQLGYRPIG